MNQYRIEAYAGTHGGRPSPLYVTAADENAAYRQFRERYPNHVYRCMWQLVPPEALSISDTPSEESTP